MLTILQELTLNLSLNGQEEKCTSVLSTSGFCSCCALKARGRAACKPDDLNSKTAAFFFFSKLFNVLKCSLHLQT